MRVGVDAMGGDYAPEVVVLGAIEAAKTISTDTTIVLFGDQPIIEKIIESSGEKLNNLEIVHTTEVIEMGESPTSAFSKKSDSSIVVGFNHLQSGLIDGFASAGSTGAMMVGCMHIIKKVDAVIRPTIATPLPTFNNSKFLLLDAGLNIDVKPEVLCQYGQIGSIYSKAIHGIDSPRVALLNIGEESEKGSVQTKAAHQLMAESKDFNFIGNVEGKSMMNGDADVIVCDGFTGNIVLKLLESFSPYMEDFKNKENQHFVNGLNYETYGGTPVLGVNAPVIIGHGCSTSLAIKNMIFKTEEVIRARLIDKIKAQIN